jgi:hypothetical protein
MNDRLSNELAQRSGRELSKRGRLVLGLFLASLSMAMVVGHFVLKQSRTLPARPVDTAAEFLSCLKCGESVDSEGRSGYERAYDLMSPMAQSNAPWIDFLLEFVALTRDRGQIQASEVVGTQMQERRLVLNYSFKLFVGPSAQQSVSELECFLLRVRLAQVGEKFLVDFYSLSAAP